MEVKAKHYLGVIGQDFKSALFQLNQLKTHKLCVRSVITLLTATYLAYYWHLPFPFWVAISVFVSIHPDIGAQIKQVIERSSAAILGCLIGYVLSIFIINTPVLWSNVIILGVAIICTYLASQAQDFTYFWMYTGLHIPLIMLLAANSPIPQVLHLVAYRPFDITIGALICIPFASTIFFQSTTKQYHNLYNEWTDDLTHWTQQAVHQIATDHFEFDTILSEYVHIREQGNALKTKLLVACFENWSWFFYVKRWQREIDVLLDTSQSLWNFYRVQMRFKQKQLSASDCQLLQEFFSTYIQLVINNMGYKQASLKEEEDFDRHLSYLTSQITPNSPLHMLLPKMRHNWSKLIKVQTYKPIHLSQDLKKPLLTWQPSHMKHAIKQSLSLLIVTWMTVLLHIPGGTLNLALAIITIMQLDIFNTYHRGAQRFLGCLLGIALGAIVILLIEPDTLWGLLLCIGVITYCLFFLTFVCQGAQYLAIQAGVAFLIVAVGPQLSILSFTSGIERAVGIMLGVIVAWTVNRTIWPDSYQQHLISEIDTMTQNLAQLAKTTRQWLDHSDQTILKTPLLSYSRLYSLLDQPSVQESMTTPFKTQLLVRARITGEIYYCLPYCIRQMTNDVTLKHQWQDWLYELTKLLDTIDETQSVNKRIELLQDQLGNEQDQTHLESMLYHLLNLISELPKRHELIEQLTQISSKNTYTSI